MPALLSLCHTCHSMTLTQTAQAQFRSSAPTAATSATTQPPAGTAGSSPGALIWVALWPAPASASQTKHTIREFRLRRPPESSTHIPRGPKRKVQHPRSGDLGPEHTRVVTMCSTHKRTHTLDSCVSLHTLHVSTPSLTTLQTPANTGQESSHQVSRINNPVTRPDQIASSHQTTPHAHTHSHTKPSASEEEAVRA
jgi:hypothetical protein